MNNTYHKLIKIYHPDKNIEYTKECNLISQMVNSLRDNGNNDRMEEIFNYSTERMHKSKE